MRKPVRDTEAPGISALAVQGAAENVAIPAEIGGVKVTKIGDMAFYWNQLTGMVIPESVTAIGEEAFAFNRLTRITMPANVEIAGSAFDNGFAAFYRSTGSRAGTYRLADGKWDYTA
jgi:hypothetical protein